MCVIFFSYRQNPRFPLVLLANRDEFYDRPTAAASFWEDAPEIFAGRDLVHGGTWLGITRTGRFSAVTNFRDPSAETGKCSRGNLVGDFLKTRISVEDYLREIRRRAGEFTGFNLLVGEFNDNSPTLGYFSNRQNAVKILEPGLYGLSNHLLDTPWQKVAKGKAALADLLKNEDLEKEKLFEILSDETRAADEDLPETGIGFEREKLLSPIFIRTPIYGTRSSSVVLVGADGEISLEERNFE